AKKNINTTRRQRMKVLITDHDPVSFDRLQQVLHGWGYESAAAPDQSAIWHGLMQGEGPVIAIIDCSGPGLDGLDVFRNIRATIKNRNIYLIMLTARTDARHIEEALEAGANGYLARPVAESDLRICLENGRRLLE